MATATPNPPSTPRAALGAAARFYAQRLGWPVFPLHGARNGRCTCGRPDCGNVGKHPRTRRGFLDATKDLEVIDRWWTEHPDSNIGVPTGEASGFVVVDVDPRNGGDDGLEALLDELGIQLPRTVETLTGGGGRHILLERPTIEGVSIRTSKLAHGVDFKADGGYIVVPPSEHGSTRAYAWEASSRPGEVAIAPLPQKLLERVIAPPDRKAREATRPVHPAAITAALRDCFLFLAFDAAGLLSTPIDAQRQAVVCPWHHEHTTGGGHRDTSSILFAPEPGRTLGWFHCSHSHCAGRTEKDVLAALPASAIVEAKRREAMARGAVGNPEPETAPREPGDDAEAEPAAEAPPASAAAAAAPSSAAWQQALSRDRFGIPKNTYGNLCIILRNTHGKRLAYDEMRAGPTLDERPLGDADVGRLREELERAWALQPTESNVCSAVRQVAEERRHHPVRKYLKGLTWDGELRIEQVASRVLGTDDPFHVRLLTAWFVAAVRRALEPGCKQDYALVLVGAQGLRKSTFFAVLGGDFFCDTTMDISSRDGLMQLAASWIYEWSELENVTSRKQAAEVKGFVTSSTDTFRPPFARAVVQHPRSSVIVGTTNEAQFLNDPTGARRFWIIPVAKRIDVELLAAWRDQLWAEAVQRALGGYQAYLDDVEEAERESQAEQHQVADAMQDAIGEWLAGDSARRLILDHGWVTMGELLELAMKIPRERWDRAAQSRAGAAMRRLGWQHVRRRLTDGRAIWVYLAPPEPPAEPPKEGAGS